MAYGRWTVDVDESLLWTDDEGNRFALTPNCILVGSVTTDTTRAGMAFTDLLMLVKPVKP